MFLHHYFSCRYIALLDFQSHVCRMENPTLNVGEDANGYASLARSGIILRKKLTVYLMSQLFRLILREKYAMNKIIMKEFINKNKEWYY